MQPLYRCVTSNEQFNLLCLMSSLLAVTWDNGSPSGLLVLFKDGMSLLGVSGSAQGWPRVCSESSVCNAAPASRLWQCYAEILLQS